VITVRAHDAAGNSATDVLTVTYSLSDSTAPSISITGPTSSSSYITRNSTISMNGTAADAIGVSQVTWSNNRGGSGTASGTTKWSVASVALQSGTNVITVTARDAVGNMGIDVLTVTRDTTAPTITITAPTTKSQYMTRQTTVNIGGTASDALGVTQVTWVNDRGGSGTATGTTNWSIVNVPLQHGYNVITVTAGDAAGNSATDVITVRKRRPLE
jgi:hypothetical protein